MCETARKFVRNLMIEGWAHRDSSPATPRCVRRDTPARIVAGAWQPPFPPFPGSDRAEFRQDLSEAAILTRIIHEKAAEVA